MTDNTNTTNEPNVVNFPTDNAAAQPEVAQPDPAIVCGSPADELLAARNEAASFKAKYMTAVADLENLRKRHNREREEFLRYGLFGIMGQLLPFADNVELSIASAQKNHPEAKATLDGFALLVPQLMQVLTNQGLSPIKPTEGAAFDPNLHQSVGEAPSDKVPHHAVLSLQRAGYTLHDRLLRPAMVILSSGPAKK